MPIKHLLRFGTVLIATMAAGSGFSLVLAWVNATAVGAGWLSPKIPWAPDYFVQRRVESYEAAESGEARFSNRVYPVLGFGWPVPALQTVYRWPPAEHPTIQPGANARPQPQFAEVLSGLPVGTAVVSRGIVNLPFALPVLPNVPGIALDSLVFGMPWLVAIWWRSHRRRTRASSGACVQCGYSMAGLDENRRCPECGAIAGAHRSP
jgi:hypothetical protein